MAYNTTAETAPYKTPKKPGSATEAAVNSQSVGASQKASYQLTGGPVSTATAKAYGKSRSRGNAQGGTVPSVVVGGATVMEPVPQIPPTFTIGQNKNVSTPVTGG